MERLVYVVSIFLLSLLFSACNQKSVHISGSLVSVEGRESFAAKQMEELIAPYKSEVNVKMDVVVGYSSQLMEVGRPESRLSNFVCDVMLQKANKMMPTDFALTNIGGLRKPIAQGDVTLRTIYEVMPFDNRLVLLDLKGESVLELCHAIAQVGGEGVAGISFGIKQGKAIDVKIQGEAVDINRIYRVVTNDYLSFGNDKMTPLLARSAIYDMEIQLRDLILDTFVNCHIVESFLDGRIYEK